MAKVGCHKDGVYVAYGDGNEKLNPHKTYGKDTCGDLIPQPAENIPPQDGAGSVGTVDKYALEDHQHPEHILSSTADPLPDGIASPGTLDAPYANEDHVHPEHILSSTAYPLPDGIASPGTLDAPYANEDHVHPLAHVYIGKIWYVGKNGNDITGTGDEHNPFLTVQAAVNAVSSSGQPGTIVVEPGIYVETVIINCNCNIVGVGCQQDIVVIQPLIPDYPALVVTDAQIPSVNAWLALGSANYLSNIGLLVPSGSSPIVRVVDIHLQGSDGYAVVPVATASELVDLQLHRVYCYSGAGAAWCRLCKMWMLYCDWTAAGFVNGSLYLSDVVRFDLEYCLVGNVGMTESYMYARYSKIANMTMNSASQFGRSNNVTFLGSVSILDTSGFELLGGLVLGTVAVSAGATFDALDVHFNNSFVANGPGVPINIFGGDISGSITDITKRLNLNECGRAYGSQYAQSDAGIGVATALINTWYGFNIFSSSGILRHFVWVNDDVNGDYLLCQEPGVYDTSFNCSFNGQNEQVAPPADFHFQVSVNGATNPTIGACSNIYETLERKTVAASGLLQLTYGDIVRLCYKCTSASVSQIVVYYLSLTLNKVS